MKVEKDKPTLKNFPDRIGDPESYYKGVDLSNRVICRNVIVFERLDRKSLQQKAVANRMHHRYVLVRVLKTPGMVSIDGQGFHLDEGDALLITPYQFHHFIDLESDDLRWLIITFELEQGESLLAGLSYRRLYPGSQADALWLEIVKLWLDPVESRKPELLPILDRLLMRLHFKKMLEQPLASETQLAPQNEWIAQIEALIIKSVREGWTLNTVAQRAGISVRHLRDRFEKRMGISLRDYRSNYQFHVAVSLMRDSSSDMSSIAELCGFNSQSVFTRFIRRMSGRTPRELCQQVREGKDEWTTLVSKK